MIAHIVVINQSFLYQEGFPTEVTFWVSWGKIALLVMFCKTTKRSHQVLDEEKNKMTEKEYIAEWTCILVQTERRSEKLD